MLRLTLMYFTACIHVRLVYGLPASLLPWHIRSDEYDPVIIAHYYIIYSEYRLYCTYLGTPYDVIIILVTKLQRSRNGTYYSNWCTSSHSDSTELNSLSSSFHLLVLTMINFLWALDLSLKTNSLSLAECSRSCSLISRIHTCMLEILMRRVGLCACVSVRIFRVDHVCQIEAAGEKL